MSNDTTRRIRDLNDAFRQAPQVLGRLMVTRGIAAQGASFTQRCIDIVKSFATFPVDADAYGEHDFGSFVIDDQKCFWKIDYYDKQMEHGSDDPSDAAKTTRVLTVMLAEEY